MEPVTIIDRNVLKIVAVDTRMDILKELSEGSRTPADLGKRLNKTSSTIVEHLDILCRAGLVKKIEQPGKKWIFYTLTEKGEGIVSSKTKRLVIILGVSVLSAIAGFTGFWSYTLGGFSARSMETASQAEKALGPAVAASQTPWFLYLSGILIAISFAGMAYYVVQKIRTRSYAL